MRILSILSIIFMIFLHEVTTFAKGNNTSEIFNLIKQKKWQNSYSLATKIGDPVLKKIVLSQRFLDNRHKDNSFEEIVTFLRQNPHWPQDYLLRLRAESYLNSSSNKKLIISWFKDNKPSTGKGHKYYALAASSLIKDKEQLSDIIKSGWHNGNFTSPEQKDYYNRFKNYLTESDHVKKIDRHLWDKEITAAKKSLYLVNAGYKKSFKAQIALIQKHKNAGKLFKKVPKKYYTSGLIYQYLNSRKRDLPSSSEIVNLSRIASSDSASADKLWKIQSYLTREFIEVKKYRDAYKVASSHFTENPGNKSDAEFLSGWLALSYLNKPKLALRHFRNFNRIVKTPISKSRGIYWLGRAHEADRDEERAQRLYNLVASKYTYTFYGQIAAMELGRKKIVLPHDVDLLRQQKDIKNYIQNNHVTRAAQLVSRYGSNLLSQTYIKSAVKQASDTSEVLNIACALGSTKNIHHMAWMSKYALHKHVFIKNHAYPIPYDVKHLPTEVPLTYSIIRQESVFDQHAISSAQARGLMQLIKDTACDTAKNVGVKCRISKLATDPKYNMRLGSNHLKELIDYYEGSYILAIAAYNAGAHNVDKWLKIYGDPRTVKNTRDVIEWLERIPFYETRNYVQRVLENLQIYRVIINEDSKFNMRNDLMKRSNNKKGV